MDSIKEKLVERTSQLLEKARQVATTRHNISTETFFAPDMLESSAFYEWRSNAQNFISLVCGEANAYYKDFIAKVENAYPEDLEIGIGILRALKEDIGGGFLNTIKDLVVAEVFTDFLDMADHLLESGYKDPAASLVGAVLEDGLRKIATKHNIQAKNSDDISSLNTKIADQDIYNRLTQRQIQTWKALRDSADHGKFNEYKAEDVKDMLDGVRRFLTGQL